jgi:hypothetical protein
MNETHVDLEKRLTVLIGLPLSIARRAADMRVFHFGRITTLSKGSYGQFALHIQCSWRIEGPEGIGTGSHDLWEPKNAEDWDEEWSYDTTENLQDYKVQELLGGYDPATRSSVNLTEKLIVESVDVNRFGDLAIKLLGGYRIVTFMDQTRGELWRFFSPNTDEDHLCMICKGL